MVVGNTSQMLKTSNFLDNVYAKSFILEGDLSSAEMQAADGNNYGKLHYFCTDYFYFSLIYILYKKN